MKILVIDGHGGGLGKNIITHLIKEKLGDEVVALGTNASATFNMKKCGAHYGATGETAIAYNCRLCERGDIITGPIGIIDAYALHGEISPGIAIAVSSSKADKWLIPSLQCDVRIIGTQEKSMAEYIEELINIIKERSH